MAFATESAEVTVTSEAAIPKAGNNTLHITEHDILEFEYGLLEDGDLEEHRPIVEGRCAAIIAEVRRLRVKAGEFDLTGLNRWKPSEWHELGEGFLDQAAPFGPLRQFIRAIAAQEVDKPSYSKAVRESGLQPPVLKIVEQMCRDGGLIIEWEP